MPEPLAQEDCKQVNTVIAAAPLAIYTLDRDGHVMTWNPAAERMFGWTAPEVLGQPLPSVPQHRRFEYDSLVQQALSGETVTTVEVQRVKKDGTTIDLSLSVAPNPDPQGQINSIVSIAADISERKKTKRRLKEVNQQLHALIESSPVAIYSVDMDGIVRSWNPAAQQTFGYREEEVLGRKFMDVVERPDPQVPGLFDRAGAGETLIDVELRCHKRGGGDIDVNLSVTPLRDSADRITGVLAVAADNTARKRAERELQALTQSLERLVAERTGEAEERAKELARSNAELEQFAYVASHDLQEPLRMVATYTELLARRYGDQLDEDGHLFISYAVDGARRMQKLIQNLLMLSRVGTRGRSPEPTDCEVVFDRVMLNLRTTIDESQAIVTHDALPVIFADSSQMLQLFQNLIGNAIRFYSDSPPRVHIAATKQDHQWLFSVRDEGIGFDSKYSDRIFEVFQRLHPRTQNGGTGIGLAICRKIVERHGGRIWAESQPGQGSTFYFTISRKGGDQ